MNDPYNMPEIPLTGNTQNVKTGEWRSRRPVVIGDLCRKCRKCVEYCPDVAIYIGEFSAEVNYYYCKGCGICREVCTYMAIEMVEE